MDTSKATARPWRWDELQLIGADGGFVIDSAPYEGQWFAGDNDDANKALIVRAVNSHDALVAALRVLMQYAGCGDYCESERSDAPCDCGCDSARDKARAALALAEQGGG